MAEPKITQAAITLLEKVSQAPRKPYGLSAGPATQQLAALKPALWWRLNEFTGPLALDESGHHRDATYEGGVAYYLDGPHSDKFCTGESNRAPHFVGGRLATNLGGIGEAYTLSLWLWNGLPNDAREINGWLYSRDHNHGVSPYGEHLGIAGQGQDAGRLLFQGQTRLIGKTIIPRWTWQHVSMVREGQKVRVYLNGQLEIEGSSSSCTIPACFLGGRSDNQNNWEGRLDEVALFPRVLSAEEIQKLSL